MFIKIEKIWPKLIFAIFAIALILYIGNRYLNRSNLPIQETSYYSKNECETKTGKICGFSTCDYAPPGKTLEEVCGSRIKKGWYAGQIKKSSTSDLKNTCEQKKGEWNQQYNECSSGPSDKGINESECKSLGGEFKECDSACRHERENKPCVTVCIRTCKFN